MALNNYCKSIVRSVLGLTHGNDVIDVLDGVDTTNSNVATNTADIATNTADIAEVYNGTELRLASVQYDDLRVPVASTRSGGTKDPDWAKFKDDGAGSQGVFLQWFDKANEEELYFELQVPHAAVEAGDLFAHIHFVPAANGASGEFVRWGLEYTWANLGDVFSSTTIIYGDASAAATATSSEDASLTAGKHYIQSLGTISGTGKSLSSMLCCRVFRDATDGTDDYDDDAGLLEIDFHAAFDSLGSTTEYTKT